VSAAARWWPLAAGLGAYAVALAAMAPATLVDAGLQSASEGRLRLAEAQGTLWSGSGQLEIRGAGGSIGPATDLAWHFRPGGLLRAQLAFEIRSDREALPFRLAISWSRIELANATISLPAASLGVGIPRLAPLGLTGEMRIHVADLTVARGATTGAATLQWRAAGSALTPISPLGDYEVRFKADGLATQAVLSTLEGPLQMHGSGTWSNSAAPTFLAAVLVPAEYREQLVPLLRLIAVERSPGNFELNSTLSALRP